MKKIRYIPYGYTMRNGQIVVDEAEAEVIRGIYDRYVSGDSLKTIAEQLTLKRVPYTEKTAVWNAVPPDSAGKFPLVSRGTPFPRSSWIRG